MDPRAGKPGPPVSLSACPQPARVLRFPPLSGQKLRKLADQGPGVGWSVGLWVVNPGWLMGMLGTQGLHWYLSFSAITSKSTLVQALGLGLGCQVGPHYPSCLQLPLAPCLSSAPGICMAAIPLLPPGSPGSTLAVWEQLVVLDMAGPGADSVVPSLLPGSKSSGSTRSSHRTPGREERRAAGAGGSGSESDHTAPSGSGSTGWWERPVSQLSRGSSPRSQASAVAPGLPPLHPLTKAYAVVGGPPGGPPVRELAAVPPELTGSRQSFQKAMGNPCEFFVDIM